jgi:hypothetical protein
MNIPYPAGSPGAESPITQAITITPNNSNDLAQVPRCLILSAAGTVKMDLMGGTQGISVPLQAGFNPIRPTRVYATGTTAGLTIVGGW